MEIINHVIQSMSREEVRHFKLFTGRTQTEKDRKDLALFDYIRKTGDLYDEEKIFSKMYKNGEKNPFYRLKNRLMGDLNRSLAIQNLELDDIIYIFHLLSLARYFSNKNNYRIAFHYIRKAEKKAIHIENYELLDFIYTEFIKLSNEIATINPEDYIRKRKENGDKLRHLREIDDILAAVTYRLKLTLNLPSSDATIFEVLEKTVDDFTQNSEVKQNPKLRFTLYNAVSRILLSRRDYPRLEEFLLKTYQEFSEEGLFNKANHDTKLQMLVYIANTLSRNGKTSLSLKFTETLHEAMEEFNMLHYKKYLFFYYNILVFNYNILDPKKCLSILEKLIQEKTFRENPFYDLLVYANLCVHYYSHQNFPKAIKTLVQVFIHDGYKTAGDTFKLRAAVFELILRSETNEFDLVEKRIAKVKKEFQEMLQKESNQVEKEMIRMITKINKSVNLKKDKNLISEIKNFIATHPKGEAGEFSFVSYPDWLKSKIS